MPEQYDAEPVRGILDESERLAIETRFGVDSDQVVRDHVISHALAAIATMGPTTSSSSVGPRCRGRTFPAFGSRKTSTSSRSVTGAVSLIDSSLRSRGSSSGRSEQ